MRVLVVEDHDDSLAAVVEYLRCCGIDAAGESSAEGCLARCLDGKFDAVLTDINLPGMTGGELALALKNFPYFMALVIGMSGGQPSEKVQCKFDRFFPKPIDLPSVCALLQGAGCQ